MAARRLYLLTVSDAKVAQHISLLLVWVQCSMGDAKLTRVICNPDPQAAHRQGPKDAAQGNRHAQLEVAGGFPEVE
jgi:hypothetical protein